MKQFDIHRFGWVLRTDLIQNRKFYLSMLLGGLIAMVCGQLGPVYVLIKMGHAESIDIERHASDLLFTFLVVYFIFTTYSVANTFRCLSTKEERINYFMLPASNLEKYLSRILIHVVGGMLAGLLLFIVADCIRMGLFLILSLPTDSIIPFVWKQITLTFDYWTGIVPSVRWSVWQRNCMMINFILSMLSLYSCFLLGSAVFRRRAYVFTWSCLFIYGFISTSFIIETGNYIGWDFPGICASEIGSIVFSATIAVVFTFLSYYLFKRIPLIPRKFFLRTKR